MHSKSDVKTENEGMKLFLQTRYRFRCCSSSVFIVAVIIFHASRTPKEIYGFSFSSSLIKPTLYTTSSYGLIPLQQPKKGIFGGTGSRTANRNLYSVHKTCITGLVPTPTRLDISRTDATSHMVNNTSATTSSGTNRVASENGLSDLRQASIGKKTVATPTNDPEWRFFDTARIHVSGGMGGNGAVAFRREKGDALGGPCGGKGGFGGSVYLICDESINTLAPLRQSVHIRAEKGHNGIGKGKDGAQGESIYVRVPPGTIVRDMLTQKVAGELKVGGEQLLVARGGRGGRGNAAFKTPRLTAPKLAEKGEPGAARWLTVELRLVADVGFLGKPNAGKSTLLAAASAAKPKIADYPFTTIFPNLGVCDIGDEGAGLVLCDIPGLIEGAAEGTGLGLAFLRHVRRCKVLLHVVDGNAEDPIGDFIAINKELQAYDDVLAQKPQVVVLNKVDIPEVQEKQEKLLEELKRISGHGRVLAISAATTHRVKELMGRLKKFVTAQPEDEEENPAEIDFSLSALDMDSDDYVIVSDPAYPGQWRVKGAYIEQVAKMTHWEYPEAVERFGRQLQALGIEAELIKRGAVQGDLVMVDVYDFSFSPDLTNPYIPDYLLARDAYFKEQMEESRESNSASPQWKKHYDFLDDDVEELLGFDEDEEWNILDVAQELEEEQDIVSGDDLWNS